jgi:hypothetical protein
MRLLAGLLILGALLLQADLAEATATRDGSMGMSNQDFVKLLSDENAYKQVYAIYNIGRRGIEAKEKLIEMMKTANPWVRRAVVFSLGLNPDESLLRIFETALGDENYGVRRAAAIALGNAKSKSATPLLLKALKDKDWDVRELAVIAIAMNDIKECVPQIVPLLNDESIRVRRTAARALGSLGDKSAVEPLKKLMTDIESKKVKPAVEKDIRAKLERVASYPYGFIHFPEVMDKLSIDSGIDLRVNDEVLYGLYINAQGPDNLDSVKLKFYHTPTGEALKEISNSAGAYFFIESGTVNIAAKSYIGFDTDIEFEVAVALYLLGDKTYEKTVKKYRSNPEYKDRVGQILK